MPSAWRHRHVSFFIPVFLVNLLLSSMREILAARKNPLATNPGARLPARSLRLYDAFDKRCP